MRYAWLLGLSLLGICACEEVTGPSGYVATFEDAGGLRAGAPVYVAGVKVGRVKTVDLVAGKAEVELLVEGMHDVEMTDKACVSIGRYAFDPETHLKLVPSKEGAPLDSGGKVSCVHETDELSERMERVTSAAVELLETALNGKGTVGRLLKDEGLADRVVAFFEAGADATTSKAEETDEAEETSEESTEPEAGADSPPPAKAPPAQTPPPPPPVKGPPKAQPALKDPQF